MILLGGFGLRFVFYDEDGPNLNAFYRRYLRGRAGGKDALFTVAVGAVMVLLAVLYGCYLVLNDLNPLIPRFFGD